MFDINKATRKKPPPFSEEHRNNLRLAGIGRIQSQETKDKIRVKRFERKLALGYINSPEMRKKISATNKGKCLNTGITHFKKGYTPWNKGKEFLAIKGEKNNLWRGGKSFEEYTIDWTNTLKRSIRERDHYTCQICSNQQGDMALDVHHIDYNKKNCNPENLITLCRNCHLRTNHRTEYWTNYFIQRRRINE